MKRLVSVLLFAAVCAGQGAAAETYTFGAVPQFDHRRIQSTWQPLLAHIHLLSGVTIEFHGSPSIPKFEQAFEAGEFDFAYMNPYHMLVANRTQGYVPLVRDQENPLYGILVVRKDSPAQTLQDLAGKMLVFPAPNAMGASLLPRAELAKAGVDFQPRYVLSHTSVYLNVVMGQAIAGGGVQATLDEQRPEVRDQLRILYKTNAVAPHPVAAHPRVPAEIQDKVRRAFLQLATVHAGQVLLSQVPIKRIGEASMEDYAPLKELGLESVYVPE